MSEVTLQSEYQRLIKNLSGYPTDIRDPLVKGVSATKTALDALDNKILDDKVTSAINGFLSVVCALNDVLEEISTSPAGAKLNEPTTKDPVPAERKKPRTNTKSYPDEDSEPGYEEELAP